MTVTLTNNTPKQKELYQINTKFRKTYLKGLRNTAKIFKMFLKACQDL